MRVCPLGQKVPGRGKFSTAGEKEDGELIYAVSTLQSAQRWTTLARIPFDRTGFLGRLMMPSSSTPCLYGYVHAYVLYSINQCIYPPDLYLS